MRFLFPSSSSILTPPSTPQSPRHNRLLTPHGRRIVLMAAAALLALPPRVPRVGDLGAGDGADVDALAVRLMQLETRHALLVRPHGRVLDAVARVRADEDGLPDDVVAGLAVRAQAERVVDFFAGRGAEEGGLRGTVSGGGQMAMGVWLVLPVLRTVSVPWWAGCGLSHGIRAGVVWALGVGLAPLI